MICRVNDNKKSITCAIAFSISLLVLSCNSKKEENTPIDLVTFPLKGEVVEIDLGKSRLMVAHEEIPNYMMAMTMPFKIKNRELFKNVQIGDTIVGTLAVSRTESWLETFTVVGKGEPASGVAPNPHFVAGAITARMLKAGDELPDDPYLNQDGKRIRFSDFKGKAVAITFIYTRCPLPDYCILISNHFAKLQKLLMKESALEGKWHLITISFDPKFDAPKVLKEYGTSYKADFTTWDFITQPDTSGRTIMKLADGLGLTYEDDEGGLIAHNLRTVVLDKEGKIVKVIQGNEWKPQELANEIKNVATK
jgi:protein SCO1/2